MNNLERKRELEPWRVILSFLQELTSDQIIMIIGRTGLSVDWSLNKQESFSHTTRIRAYMPRIIHAYSNLGEEEKLRVAWIITKELVGLGQDYPEKLNDALETIGLRIESNKLKPGDEEVKELFFPRGATHDAYVEIKKALNLAKTSICNIDPYLDGSIFQMIKIAEQVELIVKLLISKVPTDFALEARKFKTQFPNLRLEIRKTKEFHDRFIIIDDRRCFHVGASIKDAGSKAFMMSPVEDQANVQVLLSQHKQSWDSASLFTF